MGKPTDLVQGTVDLLILKTVALGAGAWLGDCAADSAGVEECAAGESGGALSGAASIGAAGLDSGGVGRIGK